MKKVLLFALVLSAVLLLLASCDTINGILGGSFADTGVCEHTFADATCKAPKTCTKCGVTEGEMSDHNFGEPTCDAPAKCLTCGIWYGLPHGHKYSPASCEAPKTCTVCGYESGSPLHSFSDATCTEPKTCKLCGETEGTALGHRLKTTVVEPTCKERGYDAVDCSRCDYSYDDNFVSKISHDDLSFVYNNDTTFEKDGTATLACPHCDYSVTKTLDGTAALVAEAFAGKKISILGDSISTYEGVSSGNAANTTNSNIRNNIVWYGYTPSQPTFGGSSVDSTWWQTVINTIGATRLVNNSNSGESVFEAVKGRCMQLHDNTGSNSGETPDIILVYLGTNDNYRTSGDASLLKMSDIQKHGDDLNYVPTTLAEAYAIMLYRIQKTYPDAEIFCLTNLERSDHDVSLTRATSQVIRDVVALFDGIHLADIGKDSKVQRSNPDYEIYMPKDQGGKSLHPGVEGMKEIARVVIDALLEKSEYMTGDFSDLLPQE